MPFSGRHSLDKVHIYLRNVTLGASEISTLWINYVAIRVSEPLFPSTMGWMVEKFSLKNVHGTGS